MSRLFDYELQGNNLHADPLAVRRVLLEKTDGRAWTYMHDLQRILGDLTTLREEEEKAKTGPDLEKLQAQIALALVASSKLEGTLALAAIEAFAFEPLDPETGTGVTEEEALDILGKYMVYAEGKG